MQRTTVFVSYSHSDRAWLGRLQVQLKPLEREGRIELWDDTRIQPGASWRDEIKEALERARVAVLLVSADFLASEFVARNELPPLLKAAKEDGATILPVIVSPCLYTEIDQLKEFQAVNDPAKPLVDLKRGEREKVFLRVARAVRDSLGQVETEPERPRPRAGRSRRTAEVLAAAGSARSRPTPWPGTMRRPETAGLRVWGQIDEQALRRIQPLEVMRNTGHSILQKCMLDDGLFVLKGTRADLCDIEALEQLVTTGPQPLPMESIHDLGLEVMATPRAVWTNDSYLWELQRYHEGRSLADLVAKDQKPLRGPALLAVVEAISGVLEALYEKNLVHRDINPGNILTLGASEFRVVDWSSCCRESSSYAGAAPFTPWLTPGYSAPEQEGGKAECASDWYSLGATCFALANGFTPHERGRKAFALGLKQIQLGRGEFRGWSEEEYFRGLLDPDPAARPKPWESKRRLFDIARDSKPAPGIG